jgi:hypothetical protein
MIDSIKRTQGRPQCKALLLQFCLPADVVIPAEEFTVQGSEKFDVPASMEYAIHAIHLSQEDRHNLRIDSTHTPKPSVHANSRLSFELPPSHVIRFVQFIYNIAPFCWG